MEPITVHILFDDMPNSSGLHLLISLFFFVLHIDMFSWKFWWLIAIGAEHVKESKQFENETNYCSYV